MIRIVAGQAGGRRLVVPAGRGTRPTSDRAREALFSVLESMRGPLTGARVLDLYAGSGAVGLEALSRGAAAALLVESDRRALTALRANVATLGPAGAEVAGAPVTAVLGRGAPAPFDVVFADPPYALGAAGLAAVLAAAVTGGWLGDGAVVAVERATRAPAFTWPPPLVADRDRRYGEATLWFARYDPAARAAT